MKKRNQLLKRSLLFFSFFFIFDTNLQAKTPAHHKVTIDAVSKCLSQTKTAIQLGALKRPLISCNIPFSFQEAELDALLTTSGSTTDNNEKPEKRIDKTSKATVKTLINVRSAKCLAKVRLKTAFIQKAIDMKNGKLVMPAQWVTCDLNTKAQKSKKIKFAFTPTGTFEKNCLTEFSPKMGKFNLDCTFCRLNFVAQTLRYWVNKVGSQFTPGINKSIGKQCQK